LRDALSAGGGRRNSTIIIEDDILDFFAGIDVIPSSTEVPRGNVDGLMAFWSTETDGEITNAGFARYLVDPLVINNAGTADRPIFIQGVRKADGTNPRINASLVIEGNSNVIFDFVDIVPSVAVCTGTLTTLTAAQRIVIGNNLGNSVNTPEGTITLYRGETYVHPTAYHCGSVRQAFAGVVVRANSAVEFYDSNIDMSRAADLRKPNPDVNAGRTIGGLRRATHLEAQTWRTTNASWDTLPPLAPGAVNVGETLPLYGVVVLGNGSTGSVYFENTTVNNTGRYGIQTLQPSTGGSGFMRTEIRNGAFRSGTGGFPVVLDYDTIYTSPSLGTVSSSAIALDLTGTVSISLSDLQRASNFTGADESLLITEDMLTDWIDDGLASLSDARTAISSAAAVVLRRTVQTRLDNAAETIARGRVGTAAVEATAANLLRGRVRAALNVTDPRDVFPGFNRIRVNSSVNYSFSYAYSYEYEVTSVTIPGVEWVITGDNLTWNTTESLHNDFIETGMAALAGRASGSNGTAAGVAPTRQGGPPVPATTQGTTYESVNELIDWLFN
jgi:hypothetical protein